MVKPKCQAGHTAVQVCVSRMCNICAFICRQCRDKDSQHVHQDVMKSLPWPTLQRLIVQQVKLDVNYEQTVRVAQALKNKIDDCLNEYQNRIRWLKGSLRVDNRVQQMMDSFQKHNSKLISGTRMKQIYKQLKSKGKYENLVQTQLKLEEERTTFSNTLTQLNELVQKEYLRFTINSDINLVKIRNRLPQDKREQFDERCRSINQNPRDPDEYRVRGVLLYNCQEYQASEQDYMRALECDSKSAKTYNNLGFLYSNAKSNKSKALQYYLKAVEYDPLNEKALNNTGNLYEQLGEDDKALEYYKRATKVNPNYASAYNDIGFVYFNRGNYSLAIQYYTQAINRQPNNSLFYANRSKAYQRTNRPKQAEQDQARANSCKQ